MAINDLEHLPDGFIGDRRILIIHPEGRDGVLAVAQAFHQGGET